MTFPEQQLSWWAANTKWLGVLGGRSAIPRARSSPKTQNSGNFVSKIPVNLNNSPMFLSCVVAVVYNCLKLKLSLHQWSIPVDFYIDVPIRMDKNRCKFFLPSALASQKFWAGSYTQLLSAWGNTTAKVINTSGNKYCSILAWAQHCTNLSLRLFGLELACVSAHRRQDPGQGIQCLTSHGVCPELSVCRLWVDVFLGFSWGRHSKCYHFYLKDWSRFGTAIPLNFCIGPWTRRKLFPTFYLGWVAWDLFTFYSAILFIKSSLGWKISL